jgi:hypothetical protein
MKTVNIPVEVSMIINPVHGVDLYFGEDELPSHSTTVLELVREWVESASVDDSIHEDQIDEAYALIKDLRDAIALITSALPE